MRYPTILLALFCVACGSYSANIPSIKPYKMDIQQGNVVNAKMMMQLRPGMSKSQVRFIMGTPLLIDSFHADRWDYFYQMRKEGKVIEQRRVVLEFEGDALAHIRGDVVPAGSDTSVPAEAAASPADQAKPAAKPKEKGWLDKLKFWGDDDADAAKTQPQPAMPTTPSAPQQAQPAKPEPVVAPASENVPSAESIAEPATPEAPLPPLMDPSMQPKPEPVTSSPSPAPQAQPAKPVETNTAVPAATPAAAEKVQPAKAQAQPEDKVMTAPQPPKDLPAEDAPDFFEKMLEKIGF